MSEHGTLTPEQARKAAKRASEILAGDARVQLVLLFGSALDASRRAISDVDLAVLCNPPLSFDDRLRLRADLVIETGAPIDLVPLEHAPVVLAFEVADTGECLFARTEDAELDFRLRARLRYFDFRPYLETQWRLMGERAEERLRGPSS